MRNFISTDKQEAISSYGQHFHLNEVVRHEDNSVGEATILEFQVDEQSNEVTAVTSKGKAHIDFLVKRDV